MQANDAGSGPAATYYTIDGRRAADVLGTVRDLHSGIARRHVLVARLGRQRRGQAHRLRQHRRLQAGLPRAWEREGLLGDDGQVLLPRQRPQADLRLRRREITIYKNGKAKKRFKLSRVTLNKAHTHGYRLTLPAGQYTWTVTATDIAGNAQVKTGTAKLSVLAMPLPTIANVQRRLVALQYLPRAP